MNKSRIRFAITALVIVMTAIIGLFIWRSIPPTYPVSFVNSDNIPYELYQLEDEEHSEDEEEAPSIATVDASMTLALISDNYCLQTTAPDYNKDLICFTVEDSAKEVVIAPNYSDQRLEEILTQEQQAIRNILRDSYTEVIDRFTIGDDRLFIRGEWYGATLTEKVSDPSNRGDVYRVIANKVGDEWSIVDIPRLAVNKYDLPDVPLTVLDEVNRMPGIH